MDNIVLEEMTTTSNGQKVSVSWPKDLTSDDAFMIIGFLRNVSLRISEMSGIVVPKTVREGAELVLRELGHPIKKGRLRQLLLKRFAYESLNETALTQSLKRSDKIRSVSHGVYEYIK